MFYAQHVLRKEITISHTAKMLMGCGIFATLTALGAYIRIPLPFTPVPITLQTFFVLLSGATLGRRWGALSQAVYIVSGAAGLPVFQGYSYGMGHLFGPTGGYLMGFIFAAFLVGFILDGRRAGFTVAVFAMMAGLAVIYGMGMAGLSFFLGTGLSQTLMQGLYPFLPGAAVKLVAAAAIYSNRERLTI